MEKSPVAVEESRPSALRLDKPTLTSPTDAIQSSLIMTKSAKRKS